MTRRNVIVAAAALVLVVLWYAFRPERLFLDQRVSFATAPLGLPPANASR